MSNELKLIKKYYGENMMHLCRESFSTLLEQEGILIKLLEENFGYTKFLYEDIIENKVEEQFKNYIYSLVDVEQKEIKVIDETPQELLKEVGYNLYECKTEEEVQSFRKYYKENERLCTFNGGRLNNCYVFFAVKENVEEIKRENFSNPKRQDEYGTSVISIQFSRGSVNTLSIKNRYNHTVNNPDATYSNNLENIKEGLTRSFEKKYNLNINQNDNVFELPGYVKANDGRYYKFNYEIGNIHYCPNNIIIDNNEVIKDYEEKEKYLIIDYFILDLQNKKISLYDKLAEESFIDGIKNISKIEVIKKEENKIINITTEEENKITIEIDKRNRIIGYSNEKIREIGNNFLYYNETLTNIDLPNVTNIGNSFLHFNQTLTSINMPKVKEIRNDFLYYNNALKSINLPNVVNIGDYFLSYNKILTSINIPNVEMIGDCFINCYNQTLISINLPNVINIGDDFLPYNKTLTNIDLPNVVNIGNSFLHFNQTLTNIDLPNVVNIGNSFLYYNKILTSINILNVVNIGDDFLYYNEILKSINLPNVIKIGKSFIFYNKVLENINIPKVEEIEDDFLYFNETLTSINLPKVEKIKYGFLMYNNNINKEEIINRRKRKK